jgi:hypothetical protein
MLKDKYGKSILVTDFLMVMWYSSEERENTESLGPPECRPVSVDRRHSSMRLRHFFIFLRPEVHRGEPRGPEPDPTDGNHGKLVEKKILNCMSSTRVKLEVVKSLFEAVSVQLRKAAYN